MLALLQRAHGLLNELGCQHDKYEPWRFASTLRHYVLLLAHLQLLKRMGRCLLQFFLQMHAPRVLCSTSESAARPVFL